MTSKAHRLLLLREGTEPFLESQPASEINHVVMHLTRLREWSEKYTGLPWQEVDWYLFVRMPGTSLARPIGPSDILEFFKWWREKRTRGNSADSYNRLLHTLKRFFEYEGSRGGVPLSPVQKVKPLRYHRAPRPILEGVEITRLLEAASPSAMDYALVLTTVGLGLRPVEILSLTEADLNFHDGIVRLKGKGRNTVQVLSHAVNWALSRDWLTTHWRVEALHDVMDLRRRPVFIRGPGDPRPLTRGLLTERLRRLAADAGLDKEVQPYTLRRSFAVSLYRAGTHPLTLAQLMRHKNLHTLLHYLRHDIRDGDDTRSEGLEWIKQVWCPGFRLRSPDP